MNLEDLRVEIDKIDDEIIKLLQKRFDIIMDVKTYKHKYNLKIENKNREQIIINKIKNQNLSQEDRIILIYHQLIKLAKEFQNE